MAAPEDPKSEVEPRDAEAPQDVSAKPQPARASTAAGQHESAIPVEAPTGTGAEPAEARKPSSQRVNVGMAAPVYPPGLTRTVAVTGGIRVTCTDGVMQLMLHHAMSGLSVADGGAREGEAIEVNGALLGRITADENGTTLSIEEAVLFPPDPENRGDIAWYTAEHQSMVDRAIRRAKNPQFQEVGDFHSHPNHELRLSGTDIDHLRERRNFDYFVAAVVRPRADPQYGGKRAVAFFVKTRQQDFKASVPPQGLECFTLDGKVVEPERTALLQRIRGALTPLLRLPPILRYAGTMAVVVIAGLWAYTLIPPWRPVHASAAIALDNGNLGVTITGPDKERMRDWGGAVEIAAKTDEGAPCGRLSKQFTLPAGGSARNFVLPLVSLKATPGWSALVVTVKVKIPASHGNWIQLASKKIEPTPADLELQTSGSGAARTAQVKIPDDMVLLAGGGYRVERQSGSGWMVTAAGPLTPGQFSQPVAAPIGAATRVVVVGFEADHLVRFSVVVPAGTEPMPTAGTLTRPSAPSPANGANNVPKTSDFFLRWNPSTQAGGEPVSYDVYFSDSPLTTNPGKLQHLGTVHSPMCEVADLKRLRVGRRCYWRVVATGAKGATARSDDWSFTVGKPGQPEQAPAPLQAANGPRPADRAQDVSTNPTLSWNPASGGSGEIQYELRLGEGGSPSLRAQDLTNTSIPAGQLKPGTKYSWLVIARDREGKPVSSQLWTFSTQESAPAAPAAPKLAPATKNAIDQLVQDYDDSWKALYDMDVPHLTAVGGYADREYMGLSTNLGPAPQQWTNLRHVLEGRGLGRVVWARKTPRATRPVMLVLLLVLDENSSVDDIRKAMGRVDNEPAVREAKADCSHKGGIRFLFRWSQSGLVKAEPEFLKCAD